MKTAQEWQKDLGLEELPDAEMLALLNEAAGMETAPFTAHEAISAGLATELDTGKLEQQIEQLYTAETVGAALGAMRGASKLGVREMGRRLGVQGSAVTKLERGENAELATVARYAAAAGYRARLVLEPSESGGPIITTPL